MADPNTKPMSNVAFSLLVSVAAAFFIAILMIFLFGMAVSAGLFIGGMAIIVVFAVVIYMSGGEANAIPVSEAQARDAAPAAAPEPAAEPAPEPAAATAPEPAPEPEPVVEERLPDPAPEPAPADTAEPVPAPRAAEEEVAPVAESAPAPAAEEVAPTTVADADKPATLDAPRDGGADNLKKIKGVGPKLEQLLHRMGFYHFDQVANWTDREVAWVDENLEGFKGRVTRDEWVAQAKVLADGGETEFSARAK
ncbi:hypothetical protein [Pontivivens ytuae]|uniref:hypothetical protein n=1 Tax=Pontivivens ytuae TaxID=2789856 RepID=UPI001E540C35|nr:hypothetical protein [Pontivivens ytuae]